MRTQVSLSVLCIALITASARAQTIYVDDDGDPENGCTSWQDACPDLHAALGLAEAGGQVLVAQGTYRPAGPNGDRAATFQLLNGVVLLGGYLGLSAGKGEDPDDRNFELYETILSGDLKGDDKPGFVNYDENSHHVITASSTDATAILDGFTVTAGHANGEGSQQYGAGLYNDGGAPLIANCIVRENRSTIGGGGVYNVNQSSPTFTGCSFLQNEAYLGGAIHNEESEAMFENCVFSNNAATVHYFEGGGGAMYNLQSSLTLEQCTFLNNAAAEGSGGALNTWLSSLTIIGCSFIENSAYEDGGALWNRSVDLSLIDCTFLENFAEGQLQSHGEGGASFSKFSTVSAESCLFEGNFGTTGGAIYATNATVTVLSTCVLRNNLANGRGGALYQDKGGSITLTDTVLENNSAGTTGGALNVREVTNSSIVGCVFRENSAEVSGALAASEVVLYIANTLFEANSSIDGAGALSTGSSSQTEIINCGFLGNSTGGSAAIVTAGNDTVTFLRSSTIVGNENVDGAAVYASSFSSIIVDSCIVWDNLPSSLASQGAGTIFVDYSNIQNGWPGHGNLDTDPMFVDPLSGNYHLLEASPCNDAGSPNPELYEDLQDIDGDPRIQHCRVDMGFDESGYYGDCNGNSLPDACEVTENNALDCNGNLVPDECELGGNDCNEDSIPDDCQADCNVTGIPDDCDLAAGTSEDCNKNAIPDECDVGSVIIETGERTPIGAGAPQILVVDGLPQAIDDVKLSFSASADLQGSTNRIDVLINGVFMGTVFDAGASNCPTEPDMDELIVPAATFNKLVASGEAVFHMVGTFGMDPDQCDLGSFISLKVEYAAASTSEDCNRNIIPDECDVETETIGDCNGNDIPDDCDVVTEFIAESSLLFPIGWRFPQSYAIPNAPEARSDVLLSFRAFADLGADSSSFIEVDINGVPVGLVFVSGADSCPSEPDTDQIGVPGETFNAVVGGGDAIVNMIPNSGVDAEDCYPVSYIAVTVEYATIDCDVDSNGNGIPDECECAADLDGDGVVNPLDLALLLGEWGACPEPCAPCPAGTTCGSDISGDCIVGPLDLAMLLGAWGPCP